MNKLIVIKRKWIVAQVMFCISMMLLAGVSIQYANYVDRKSNQSWCELINFYTDYYNKTPPATELQKRQAELMHNQAKSLGCKEQSTKTSK